MKNVSALLLATAGALYAQQQSPPLIAPLKCTEPIPAQVIGQIPPGWQIVELKDQKIIHGPIQLPDGQWVTLSTPKYVLQPMLEYGSLYLLQPGFNPKDQTGNARAGTLSALLYIEMEALRVSTENLRPIMAQFAKVQNYVQRQQSGAVPPLASNQKTIPIEEQTPPLPASALPRTSPALTPTPIPTDSPAPVQDDATPAPTSSPTRSFSPANEPHPHRSRKKKAIAPTASPVQMPRPSPTAPAT